ncbi:MbcA/ParS/Xre antitoxin family protein [Sneathiella limimaris]|uniref:MbcA/ParS/Xre antitoxin family protein n=1 Tax=Sneathiella limimaris TaxID=1964213 RepID=UPI0019D0A921|nr:MbcA/ParS/Xre antitoxin family protein [Sneathiella limimaris]
MTDLHHDPGMPTSEGIEFTLAETQAMQRAILKLLALWKLTDDQVTTLLGGISISEFQGWREGQYGSVDPETPIRMSNLIGIHKCLRRLFSDPERDYDWIKRPNTVFDGRSALEVMLKGHLTDIIVVRRHLFAECET